MLTTLRFLTAISVLIADGLVADTATRPTDPAAIGYVPAVDMPAPRLWSGAAEVHSGGQASRIEFDDADHTASLSPFYRLAYVDGGTRLRVFDHYPAAIVDPDPDVTGSEAVAWRLANKVVGPAGSVATGEFPRWARFRTGNDTGGSGGLMFTLAYIDVLTPGTLVGGLRVTGSGGIGPDGVVFPVSNLEVKVAAAMLTRPDVIFATRPPKQFDNVTIVEAHDSRHPTNGETIGEWLNVVGYEQAGREAARRPGTVAIVVVHDFRQALAWLCGRTERAIACAAAHRSVTIPIGAPQAASGA